MKKVLLVCQEKMEEKVIRVNLPLSIFVTSLVLLVQEDLLGHLVYPGKMENREKLVKLVWMDFQARKDLKVHAVSLAILESLFLAKKVIMAIKVNKVILESRVNQESKVRLVQKDQEASKARKVNLVSLILVFLDGMESLEFRAKMDARENLESKDKKGNQVQLEFRDGQARWEKSDPLVFLESKDEKVNPWKALLEKKVTKEITVLLAFPGHPASKAPLAKKEMQLKVIKVQRVTVDSQENKDVLDYVVRKDLLAKLDQQAKTGLKVIVVVR